MKRVLGAVLLAAAGLIYSEHAQAAPPELQVIVVRRGWHIDLGFAVSDLEPPLRAVAADLPGARYLFFGFGDMHYLLAKNHGSSTLAAALWPGHGVMLVTGLVARPEQGFGNEHVIALDISDIQARRIQDSIWQSFRSQDGVTSVYRSGPYQGSLYYLSVQTYSALHTCNTWAAESLKAGQLKMHSRGTLFAGQVWSQVKRLKKAEHVAPSVALTAN